MSKLDNRATRSQLGETQMVELLMADEKKPGKKKSAEKEKRPVVLLDPDMHYKLRMVCAALDVSIRDYVHNLLSQYVEKEFRALKLPDRP